ncbi:hypothetical protein RE628_07400 [Paenibacillus sp. D2_2]|uniref:hypothetical protein n=1 Tax=Paenibacillus sp. D2_2 TaxID=3073092 RepID=UPI0028166894|nr:hypothetical protein [Paenibacillus sp. D2_2]WMT42223.1 hypothetical protein RE628_07400 [Paenibacillus sp. D2_2]
MSIGHLIGIGFEKQFQLSNSLLTDYSEVLDLYALKYGIQIQPVLLRYSNQYVYFGCEYHSIAHS